MSILDIIEKSVMIIQVRGDKSLHYSTVLGMRSISFDIDQMNKVAHSIIEKIPI